MKKKVALAAITSLSLLFLAGMPSLASADNCAPVTGAQLDADLADANCTHIFLAAVTYDNTSQYQLTSGVDVVITGAGAGLTTVTQSGSNSVLRITSGSATIEDLELTGATNGSGLSVSSSAVVRRVLIDGNHASSGGGINFTGSSLSVSDSVIQGNTADSYGGGATNGSGAGTELATFTRVLFNDNEAGINGGGFGQTTSGAETELTDVTFTGNKADSSGGGVSNGPSSTLRLRNSTLVGNVADLDTSGDGDGGGLMTEGPDMSIANSIVSNNADAGGPANPDCYVSTGIGGKLARGGYVLIRDQTGCTFTGTGDTAVGYQTGVDPQLSSLSNNGGSIDSEIPLPGSPVLDKIPAASCISGTDQRGIARPQGGLCDLGAVERQVFPPLPFSNPAAIAINDEAPASPYPAPINVAGLVGKVTGVSVRIDGLTHSYANDVSALLVGPQGQSTLLFAYVGSGEPVNGSTVTLSDGGPAIPGISIPLLSGTYAPTNFPGSPVIFPAPAPAPPYASALAAFNGTAPNGTWNLFIQDDGAGDIGSIAYGWSLDVKTDGVGPPVAPPARPKCPKGKVLKTIKNKGKKKKKCVKKKRKKK